MAYTGTSVAGGEGNTTFNATSKLDFLGKELEIFTVDFVDDMSGQTAKGADQQNAEDTIRIYGNIVAAGPLHNSDTEKTYISEGTDMYVGSPASSGAVPVACLQFVSTRYQGNAICSLEVPRVAAI